jgi:predicted ATP-grasp superfamily ATP-dependent carboligase
MRVLLSDGSGLTSRQVATQLDRAGHVVDVLVPGGLPITRFTRHVRRVHRVTRYGVDPFGWLDEALDVARSEGIDCLFPTQEQAALLARAADRVRRAGLACPVPPFSAICAVQDKISATETLTAHGVPQPATTVARTRPELLDSGQLPAWVKTAIGTASTGVRFVRSKTELEAFVDELDQGGELGNGVVVQQPAAGPLAMVQTVFSDGDLVAFHANLRLRAGHSGGAAVKESIDLTELRAPLAALGRALGWHGALSCDAIIGPDGPVVIDVNPRLVEPGNAWRSGVDLVDAMLCVAFNKPIAPRLDGRVGVRTHQLLIAVLGAAQQGRHRRGIFAELTSGVSRRGPYRQSAEELTPLRGDWRAAVPVAAASLATLTWPDAHRFFGGSAVSGYALTAQAWETILTTT